MATAGRRVKSMPNSTQWRNVDVLSEVAVNIATANDGAYDRLTPTRSGSARAAELLRTLQPEQLLTVPVRRPDDARAMLAGLWLYHDFLDESHRIFQDLHSSTGSFWHAIMHRREGDFPNAKYWYARCRHHPALAAVGEMGRAIVTNAGERAGLARLVRGEWDPAAFVDVVEAVHQAPDDPLYATAVALQRVEWQALFAHCANAAANL
jgi:hypothetical protein